MLTELRRRDRSLKQGWEDGLQCRNHTSKALVHQDTNSMQAGTSACITHSCGPGPWNSP